MIELKEIKLEQWEVPSKLKELADAFLGGLPMRMQSLPNKVMEALWRALHEPGCPMEELRRTKDALGYARGVYLDACQGESDVGETEFQVQIDHILEHGRTMTLKELIAHFEASAKEILGETEKTSQV